MSDAISRNVIDALLPDGPIWQILPDGDLDRLIDGISGNSDQVKQSLESLAYIRDPLRTQVLPDLEKEYGILPNDIRVDEATRRKRLWVRKNRQKSDGSAHTLEEAFTLGGFDLHVYDNHPGAVDPASILFSAYAAICGDDAAVFGDDYAVFGGFRGELIANGVLYIHVGGNKVKVNYNIPSEAYYWPLVFFVGGTAEYNQETGAIINVDFADVPISRKNELRRLIIKYKPLHSWCGLLVNYV